MGSLILINRITNATSSCAIINDILNNKNLFYHNAIVTSDDRKKSLSIKNKTIYEQSSNVTPKTRKDDDDAWINDAKHDKILQKDINKQFDMVGQ